MEKRSRLELASWAFVAAVGFGCASYKPPAARPIENERTFAASFDSTWAAIIAIAGENNMQIKAIEKDSGLIAFERMNGSRDVCDCGVPGTFQQLEQIACDVNIIARRDGAGTQVRVNLRAQGLVSSPSGNQYQPRTYQWIPCTSMGTFERSILNGIEARVGGATTQP